MTILEPPSEAKLKRRIDRALMELDGNVSEPMAPGRRWSKLGLAMNLHLGQSMGLSTPARWHEMTITERELLCDALEERSAIVGWS